MAHYHWQKARKTYKLTYTLYIGGSRIARNKYSVDKNRIEDFLAATTELETASRTGIAPTASIYDWVQRKFLSHAEAERIFVGYHDAAERAGLLTAKPNFVHLRQAYRTYCEKHHTRQKSGYDGWHRGDRIIDWLKYKSKAVPFAELSESVCEEYIRQLLVDRSTQTVGHHLTALRIILDEAVRKKMIATNPARMIKPPAIHDANQRTILTPDQIQWVKEASLRPQHSTLLCGGIGTAVRLGLYGGMRNGEMTWLKWSRVNLENGTVHIAKTLAAAQEWVPKDFQLRVIDLKREAVEYLREVKKGSLNGKKDGFVLRSDKSNSNHSRSDLPIYGGSLSIAFKKFMQREGRYGEFTIYSFRHTYATSLLRSGVDIRTVQHLMGHENIKTTQKYLHPLRAETHPSDALNY